MTSLFKTLKEDWSLSATVAGFLAVLISYSGPLIIFFQAAQKAQVSPEMMISWIWGISIGAALTGIYLSIRFKTPIITAWSAPGTALLVTLFPIYYFRYLHMYCRYIKISFAIITILKLWL